MIERMIHIRDKRLHIRLKWERVVIKIESSLKIVVLNQLIQMLNR
jgi:hypothetical protein